jgi:hypothetical protein
VKIMNFEEIAFLLSINGTRVQYVYLSAFRHAWRHGNQKYLEIFFATDASVVL